MFTSQPQSTLLQEHGLLQQCLPILSPRTARMTAHLCPDQAMRNVELVQSCTEILPAEKNSQNRTEDIKVPQVSYSPSSSPRGPVFPQALVYVVPLPNPMRLPVHSDQGPSRKLCNRWTVNTKRSTPDQVTLVTYTRQMPRGNRKFTTRSNTPSIQHIVFIWNGNTQLDKTHYCHTTVPCIKCHSYNCNGRSDTPK